MITREVPRSAAAGLEEVGWAAFITAAGLAAALCVLAGLAAPVREVMVVWLALLCLGLAAAGAIGIRTWTARALVGVVLSLVVVAAVAWLEPALLPRPSREQLAFLLIIGLFGITLQLWFVFRWLVPAGISALILIAVAATVYARQHVQQQPAAQPAAPVVPLPLGLQSRQAAGMAAQLSWIPVSGAQGYLVKIGGYTQSSSGPTLTIRDTLAPGQAYTWSVRPRFASGPGMASPPSSIRLRPVPVKVWHFAAGATPSSLVTLYNDGNAPARVRLSGLPGTVRPPRIVKAQSGIEISLPALSTAFQIASNRPVIVTRVVTQGTAVRSVYGIPGPLHRSPLY